MRKIIYFLSLMCVLSVSIFAQSADGIKANLAVGEVSAINTAENKISLQTTDGAIDAILSAKTVYKKILPENPSPTAAVLSTLSEIGIGDRILVTGLVATDKKSLPAKAVYLMTKADISKKQTADADKWKRGVSGKVSAVNVASKEITLTISSFAGEKTVILTPNDKSVYRRYAENSVNYNDAKKSSFSEISVGDQVRAVGEKSADGGKMTVEEMITGTFRQVLGKITAVDAAKNEITIKDAKTNKPVVVVLNENVSMKKFPAEMVQMMMMRSMGGGAMPSGVRPPNQTGQTGQMPGQPNGQSAGQGGGQGRGNGGGGNGGFDEMLERLPKITIADLKVGDTIGTLTATNAAQNRITAIKLLSGIEGFLNAPQPAGGRGGQNNGPSMNIPGLDGGLGF